jgi:hypothetical protein
VLKINHCKKIRFLDNLSKKIDLRLIFIHMILFAHLYQQNFFNIYDYVKLTQNIFLIFELFFTMMHWSELKLIIH